MFDVIKPPTLKEMEEHMSTLQHDSMQVLATLTDSWGQAFRLAQTANQVRRGQMLVDSVLAQFGSQPMSSLK